MCVCGHAALAFAIPGQERAVDLEVDVVISVDGVRWAFLIDADRVHQVGEGFTTAGTCIVPAAEGCDGYCAVDLVVSGVFGHAFLLQLRR